MVWRLGVEPVSFGDGGVGQGLTARQGFDLELQVWDVASCSFDGFRIVLSS